MSFIPALFGYSYYALLPAWGREALDIGSEDLGLMMMLMGVGALVGTLTLASMRNFKRRGASLLVLCLLWVWPWPRSPRRRATSMPYLC